MVARDCPASARAIIRSASKVRIRPSLSSMVVSMAARQSSSVFAVRSAPAWVGLLFVARQALSPLVGIPKGTLQAFAPAMVEGDEVLVDTPDRHLHFWLGLAVRQDPPRLVATTVVKLKGWRGRLYWLPVGVLHRPVLAAMMRRAVRRERAERRRVRGARRR